MYKPKFNISQLILKNIGVIEACKEVITTAPLIPSWEKQFQTEAAARTIHFGTHLEGNELSFNQAKKVIEGKEIIARSRDVREVINYRNVLNFIENLGKPYYQSSLKKIKPFSFSEDILRNIHSLTVNQILDPKDCGQYRTSKVVIKIEKTGEVVFMPISPLEIKIQLEDFFTWLNDNNCRQVHSVLRAAISHFELVRIHPFIDGNGRVARAFAILVLFVEGYDIKKLFSLEEYFDKQPLEYYQALGSVTIHQRDLTTWLEYFTKVLAIELTKIKEKIQHLSLDSRLKDKLGRQIAISARQVKLMEYLKINESITVVQASELIPDVSEDTLWRDLKDLIKKGIVRKRGKTKSVNYRLLK